MSRREEKVSAGFEYQIEIKQELEKIKIFLSQEMRDEEYKKAILNQYRQFLFKYGNHLDDVDRATLHKLYLKLKLPQKEDTELDAIVQVCFNKCVELREQCQDIFLDMIEEQIKEEMAGDPFYSPLVVGKAVEKRAEEKHEITLSNPLTWIENLSQHEKKLGVYEVRKRQIRTIEKLKTADLLKTEAECLDEIIKPLLSVTEEKEEKKQEKEEKNQNKTSSAEHTYQVFIVKINQDYQAKKYSLSKFIDLYRNIRKTAPFSVKDPIGFEERNQLIQSFVKKMLERNFTPRWIKYSHSFQSSFSCFFRPEEGMPKGLIEIQEILNSNAGSQAIIEKTDERLHANSFRRSDAVQEFYELIQFMAREPEVSARQLIKLCNNYAQRYFSNELSRKSLFSLEDINLPQPSRATP